MGLTWTGDDGYIVALDQTAGIVVCDGVLGVDAPPVDLFMAPLVSTDGSVLVKHRKPIRRVVLPLLFDAGANARDAMHSLLRSTMLGGTLRYSGLNIRDLRQVRYESGAEQAVTGRDAGVSREDVYPFSLLAFDPWWYGQTASIQLTFAAAVGFDAAIAFSGVTGFDGSDANPVTIAGDATAFPVVTMVGPFTTLQVGVAGGQTFTLAAALAAGSTVIVDSAPGNRGPRRNAGAIDWSLLTPASRLWELPVGSSVLNAAATGTTGASIVEVAWRERWLTP